MHVSGVKPCMRLHALLAACILVIPTDTSAQSTAADGVLALFQGDPASAVRILSPLVEGRGEPDPLATFFLALAYRSAGPGNSMRSCGLFMKAATPSSPLLRQAELLANESHLNHEIARNQCAIAAKRPWGQPAWTTFTLAPAHRVRIDQNGFTVEYEGASKLTPEGWGGAGWQFLPIRLTEVDVAAPGEARRYFIEFFAWNPHTPDDAPEWSLAWFVYEVVGPDVIRREPGDGRVARTVGAAPPLSFAPDEVARLVSDAAGQVERVVIGPEARRVPLPPRTVK
jgi:hypothetical protein